MTRNTKRSWSVKELEYVRDNINTITRVLAEELDRTTASVSFVKHKIRSDPDYVYRKKKVAKAREFDLSNVEYFKEREEAKKRHVPLKLKTGSKYSFYRRDGSGFEGDEEYSVYIENFEGTVVKEYDDYYLIQCEHYKTTVYKHCSNYKIKELSN